jgi:hypothetical protein
MDNFANLNLVSWSAIMVAGNVNPGQKNKIKVA